MRSPIKVSAGSSVSMVSQVLGLVVIVSAYLVGVLQESLFSDDYSALMMVWQRPGSYLDFAISQSRPILGLTNEIGYSLVQSPTDAAWLRVSGLTGLLLAFIAVTLLIPAHQRRPRTVLPVAIAFCLPTFQMYVHWALAWSFTWSILFGLLGWTLWLRGRIVYRTLGVSIVIAGFLIYQPTIFFVFGVIFYVGLVANRPSRIVFRQLGSAVLLVSLGGALSVVLARAVQFALDIEASDRMSIVNASDVIEKGTWLLSRPTIVSLQPFMSQRPDRLLFWLLIVAVLVVLMSGMILSAREVGENPVLRLMLLASSFALSLAPIALTSENQIEHRTIPGSTWLVAATAVYSLVLQVEEVQNRTLLGRRFQTRSRRRATGAVLISVAAVAVVTTNVRYETHFRQAYEWKNDYLQGVLAECDKSAESLLIQVRETDQFFPSRSNIGSYSIIDDMQLDWVRGGAGYLNAIEVGFSQDVEVVRIQSTNRPAEDRVCVVQMDGYVNELRAGRSLPRVP